MVTTDKNVSEYSFTCECGRKLEIASGQPSGDTFPVICKCYRNYNLMVPEHDAKYSYAMREETRIIRNGIIRIFQDIKRTMTVRQVFYQAVNRYLVPKDEKGYNVIQRNLLEMRRHGHLPYSFVADVSRRFMKADSYTGARDAFNQWIRYYKQDVWANQDAHVEIWLEKEALGGIFLEVTREFDVPLFMARGFSSESFLYEASEMIKEINKPTYVYFFSDYDPSGLALCKQVEQKLPKFGVDINFTRVALNQEQIEYYNLPTRPTKKTSHSKGFDDNSVELDALHPDILHQLIKDCVMQHISQSDLENIRMEEEVHKGTLLEMRNKFTLA